MSRALTNAERRRELLTSLGVIVGGGVLLLASFAIPTPARTSPGLGPSVLPMLVSAGLIVCGLLLAVTAWRGKDPASGIEDDLLAPDDADELEELLHEEPQPVPWLNLGVILALMVVYALTFIPVGFIASTTLFLFALTTYVHPARWLRNLIFAALVAVGVYFLFRDGLSVPLPAGILG